MKKTLLTAFRGMLVLVLFLLNVTYLLAQSNQIAGTVKGAKGEAMPGVTVVLKGANKGTNTDPNGAYSLEAPSGSTLVFSAIGYQTQEVALNGRTTVDVTMAETTASLDEVVVTGVFDKRTALESSIAISKLDNKTIAKLAPNSAADLLSFTPGVYVNSALGEINNTVYSRGVNANQFAASGVNGYYYVSLMEDGLPVSNISSGVVVPDRFYRADATLSSLESVRGGSASITANNAPGGIFNYVSLTGLKPVNEIRYKVGLEGDGINLFNRLDGNLGGRLSTGNWYYNVGGFYRHSQGPRYPGYAQNKGGQIKANLVRTLANGGNVKIYAKFLRDRNGIPQNLPAVNYDNPRVIDGFSNTDSYMLPAGASVQPLWERGRTFTFDPSKLVLSQDVALGSELNLNLNNGWSLSNNVKGSLKHIEQDLTIMASPTSLTSVLTYALMGMVGPGQFSLRDQATGRELAAVSADFSRGPSFRVTSNSLPNQQVLQNGVLFNFTNYIKSDVQELIEQLNLNKKIGKHSVTAGTYMAFTRFVADPTGTANTSLRPIQNRAAPLDIVWTLPNGTRQQVTGPLGYARWSGGGFAFRRAEANQNQIAVYLADGYQPTEQLNIDLGARLEYIGVKGANTNGVPNADANRGGLDGNALTLYDNGYYVKGPVVPFQSSLNLLSYSAGINYLLTRSSSVYARFSNGQKAPDLQFYTDNFTNPTASPEVKAQVVTQFEVGYKFKGSRLTGSVIPFYSRLSNIPVSTIAQNEDGSAYYTPVVYNAIRTLGLEAEANLNLAKGFSVNGNVTVQSAKAEVWQNWIVGANGQTDDKLSDFNGNTAVNVPTLMFNLSPLYTFKKGFILLNYRYMGDRQANIANTFILPGFGQLNVSAGYELTKRLSLNLNVNNALNTLGIMNWMATTQYGLTDAFNHNSFTPERRRESPNSVFQILPIQPRAYFLTARYTF